MKKLTAIALTVLLVGCTSEQSTPAKVKMSVATEACFDIGETLKEGFEKHHVDPSSYVSSDCGTEEQHQAFLNKNYTVE